MTVLFVMLEKLNILKKIKNKFFIINIYCKKQMCARRNI